MLTSGQRRHFATFGFIQLRQAYSATEMATINQNFDDVLAADRHGDSFDGEKRQAVLGFIEKRPALTALVEDDRIYESVEALLGPGFVWIGSDGNLYVGNTGWHADTHGSSYDYPRIKVAFYLDPVAADTGALRVVPGSHLQSLHGELKQHPPLADATTSTYGINGIDVPYFPITSEPGDVVIFNQNIWHASYGGRAGRRMLALSFGAKPTTDAHISHLRNLYEMNLDNIRRFGSTHTYKVYEEEFLHNDRPRIRSMVSTLVELGFE